MVQMVLGWYHALLENLVVSCGIINVSHEEFLWMKESHPLELADSLPRNRLPRYVAIWFKNDMIYESFLDMTCIFLLGVCWERVRSLLVRLVLGPLPQRGVLKPPQVFWTGTLEMAMVEELWVFGLMINIYMLIRTLILMKDFSDYCT